MNARLLADFLLEMNILNPNELKREVRKLGAHISDPRARQWYMRVVTYWMVNIDKLFAEPYRAVAEPRTIRASKYNFQSSGQWAAKPPEDSKEYSFKSGTETLPPGQSHPASTFMVKPDEWGKGENVGVKTGFGIFTCPDCKGKGTNAQGTGCPVCHSSGRVRRATSATGPVPLYIEVKRGTVPKKHREGFFPESHSKLLVTHLLDEAELPEQPDPEGVYTSTLHQPDIKNQIDQSFSPFRPSKALPKKQTMLGDPWGQEDVPPWATDDKELFHFNPIQVRRRELFQRLEAVVDFLNYQHALSVTVKEKDVYATLLAQAEAEGDEPAQAFKQEQLKAREAKDYMRFLETMKTEDIDGFRKVMRDAEEFKRLVSEQPWLFIKDMQVIASQGVYKIVKVQSVPSSIMMTSRSIDPPWQGQDEPTWCTDSEGHANTYLRTGALYFIDKNNQPYVLTHFPTSQCSAPNNVAITATVANEIAPVCSRSAEFVNQLPAPVKPTSANQSVGLAGLAYYVRRLRAA